MADERRNHEEVRRRASVALALDFGRAWDYAPAPEATDHVKIAPRQELFIGGRCGAPRGAASTSTRSARAPRRSSPRSPRRTSDDVDDAVQAARRAYDRYWSKMRGSERAKYLFRIARAIQEKARELAIVESMDGGKPIKESRDVDLPLAAAHFFYHAGWADKLDYAFHGRAWRPLGVAGQIIPWNFPLLMAAWKIAPALACGNTVVLKPAETTPLTALLLAQHRRGGRAAAGRRQRRHRRGRDRRGARRAPGRRQGRLHRVDRGRQAHPARRSPGRRRS